MAAVSTRLGSHADSAVCCEVVDGLLLSGGEDGQLRIWDLVSHRELGSISQAHRDAVVSVCAWPGHPHHAFAAAGQAIMELDLRKGHGEAAVLRSHRLNADEVNQLAANRQGTWLAAADDGGEVVLLDLQQARDGGGGAAGGGHASYKTLRRGHANICSSAAFRPHKPCEVLSGGLDCTVAKWDFSRLRRLQVFDMSPEAGMSSAGQMVNPPMVHSLAVPPEEDGRASGRLFVAARGDGCLAICDADFRRPAGAAGGGRGGKPPCKAAWQDGGREKGAARPASPLVRLLGRDAGGHTAAANCVAFSAGGDPRLLLSAGNDGRLLAWDWACCLGASVEEAAEEEHVSRPLAADVRLGAKLNWVCACQAGGYTAVAADVRGSLAGVALLG